MTVTGMRMSWRPTGARARQDRSCSTQSVRSSGIQVIVVTVIMRSDTRIGAVIFLLLVLALKTNVAIGEAMKHQWQRIA